MCQMCEEYEAELVRMGIIEEARKVRAERHGEKRDGEFPKVRSDRTTPKGASEAG